MEKELTVVIIEDSPLARIEICNVFKEHNFNVIAQCAYGNEAIDTVEYYLPDAITLDNILPDSFGLDLVKELKKKSPDSKIIVITSVSDKEILKNALREEVDDYIIKPYEPETLTKAIRRIIEG